MDDIKVTQRDKNLAYLGYYTGHLIKCGIISNVPHKVLLEATVNFVDKYRDLDLEECAREAIQAEREGKLPKEEEINKVIAENSKSPTTHN